MILQELIDELHLHIRRGDADLRSVVWLQFVDEYDISLGYMKKADSVEAYTDYTRGTPGGEKIVIISMKVP